MQFRRLARTRARWRKLAPLRADRRGNVALEFALVGPLFIALLLASLHTALVFFAQEGLETAAETTARVILTGQAQTKITGNITVNGVTQTPQQQFHTIACAALPPFLTCNRLYVDVTTVSNYASAVTSPPTFTYDANGNVTTAFNYQPGAQGAIVVLRLMYLWPTIAGPNGFSLVNTYGSNRLLQATSVMKTEGY